nr:hypothetical protein [Tanacetum cinerariifolium]
MGGLVLAGKTGTVWVVRVHRKAGKGWASFDGKVGYGYCLG